MFTIEERDRVRDLVIEMARNDDRIVGAAEVGSLALGGGDQWSDIDLTFAVDGASEVAVVLDEWSKRFTEEMDAVQLFDLAIGPIAYRVFMFADCLQLDVSFSPASEFAPTSPRFRPIFGTPGEMQDSAPADPAGFLGWSVMWARHARVCIERGQFRRAEHAISKMRETALDYASARRGFPSGYGRGLEHLPADVHDSFSLVPSFERKELIQVLKGNVVALIAEYTDEGVGGRRMRDRLSDTIKDL